MKSSFLWSCYIYSSYDLVVILWLENEACQCLCEKEIANCIIVEYINRSKRLKVVAYLYSWCWFRIMIIIIEFIYYSVPLYVSILVSGSSINFYPGDWISGRSFCCTLLAHLFLALSISSVLSGSFLRFPCFGTTVHAVKRKVRQYELRSSRSNHSSISRSFNRRRSILWLCAYDLFLCC